MNKATCEIKHLIEALFTVSEGDSVTIMAGIIGALQAGMVPGR